MKSGLAMPVLSDTIPILKPHKLSGYEIGVILCILGNLSINLGTNLVKIGGTAESRLGNTSESRQKSTYKGLCLKICGWTLFICGNGGNFYALSMAPQALLGCLGSIQFISNLLFSWLWLKEQITLKNMLGTAAVIGGVFVMLLDSPLKNTKLYDPGELLLLYNDTVYKVYLFCVILLFTLLHVLRKMGQLSLDCPQMCQWLDGLVYSSQSAMFGTQSLVLGKSLAFLVKLWFQKKLIFFTPEINLFNIFFSVGIFTMWGVATIFWMYRMGVSLTLFDSMFIIPLNQCMWIIFSVISGGIYFHEFQRLSLLGVMRIVYAMILIVVGVFYLVPERIEKMPAKSNAENSPFLRASPSLRPRLSKEFQALKIQI